MEPIQITSLNFNECARYLGYKGNSVDGRVEGIMLECEKNIINNAVPRYVYKKFPIVNYDEGIRVVGTNLTLTGNSIKLHLKNCNEVILLCCTLSAEMDKQIRIAQLNDMAYALVLDAMCAVAIEQVCDKIEALLHLKLPEKFLTYRFGIGYGDLPITLEQEFLLTLNAQKQIGLTSNESYIMSPRKSVACIIGISDEQIIERKRSCSVCNLNKTCEYRRRGDRCGY